MKSKTIVPKTCYVILHRTASGEELYWGQGKLLPLDEQIPAMAASEVEAESAVWQAESQTGLGCEWEKTTFQAVAEGQAL